jgi:hypothetical protein
MRDDNLYVHGFINKQGDCYGLRDKKDDKKHKASGTMIPSTFKPRELKWGVSYRSMVGTKGTLAGMVLGRHFAKDAVRTLSTFRDQKKRDKKAGLALAGLILMVCESARFNPLHDFFVLGWKHGTKWRQDLMDDYVWKYAYMSSKLLKWKDERLYAQPHPIEKLQAIYLVLNTNRTRTAANPGGRQQLPDPSPSYQNGSQDSPGHGNDRANEKSDRHRDDKLGRDPNDHGIGGSPVRKLDHATAANTGSDSQSEEFGDGAGSTGGSEEASDDCSSRGVVVHACKPWSHWQKHHRL